MIRKISVLISLCTFTLVCFSQRVYTREEYIQTYRDLAIHEMQRAGVPASITLAQACLESGNGNSELSRKSNNHFGIKCKSSWNGKRAYHHDDMRNECFRHYESVEESFIDHSDFLSSNPRYGDLFQLDITDYKGWARGLKKAGYATASNYAESLIKIIEDYQLYVYDQGVDDQQHDVIVSNKQNNQSSPQKPNSRYLHKKVTFRNGLKSVIVKTGDTPQRIADEFNLKLWELYKYNDLPDNHRLKVNEILYIVPKHKKALRNFRTHVVQPDESMHYVAQRYGIRLKKLYSLNRMKYGERAITGRVLYLRKKAPR